MTYLMFCSESGEDIPEACISEKTMTEECIFPLSPKINYFFEMLDYEFQRAVRYKNALTLMFIKLCQLEELAGRHGQLDAERAVSEVEKIIRTNIRVTDRGFKYGTDEFMIILPNTSRSNARYITEKLKRLIENYRFKSIRGTSLNLTPKFGIATFPYQDEDECVDEYDVDFDGLKEEMSSSNERRCHQLR